MNKNQYLILSAFLLIFWLLMTIPFGIIFGWYSPIPSWYFIILFLLAINFIAPIMYNLFTDLSD